MPHFTILSSEMQSVVYVDSHYTDTVHATDDDGDQITYILLDNTNSLVIADDSILTWTPTEDDIGTHRVSVIADDGNGGTDTLSWNISVISVTSPPYPLISFDSPMIGEINPNVDVDRYWFNGTAGDIITLRVDPDGNGSSLDPDSRIQIVGPDDSVVLDHSVK